MGKSDNHFTLNPGPPLGLTDSVHLVPARSLGDSDSSCTLTSHPNQFHLRNIPPACLPPRFSSESWWLLWDLLKILFTGLLLCPLFFQNAHLPMSLFCVETVRAFLLFLGWKCDLPLAHRLPLRQSPAHSSASHWDLCFCHTGLLSVPRMGQASFICNALLPQTACLFTLSLRLHSRWSHFTPAKWNPFLVSKASSLHIPIKRCPSPSEHISAYNFTFIPFIIYLTSISPTRPWVPQTKFI